MIKKIFLGCISMSVIAALNMASADELKFSMPKFKQKTRTVQCYAICNRQLKNAVASGELKPLAVQMGTVDPRLKKCYKACYCYRYPEKGFTDSDKDKFCGSKPIKSKTANCRWYNPFSWFDCLRGR